MLNNLKAEMARQDISRKKIADSLNVRYATIVDKINGKYEFKLSEAFQIKKTFFPDMSIEYLFDSGGCRDQQEQAG